LRSRSIRFVLATNNAMKTPLQFQTKLKGMGVEVSLDEILTSSQAVAIYLRQHAPRGAKVFVVGEEGIRQAIAESGFVLWDAESAADYVVVGMDHGLNWEKLARATLNIRAGAKFIGTNSDATFPTERGIVFGNGSILALLKTATDVEPLVIGKPAPIMYQQAMERLGGSVEDTAALGDRLETDILGAVRAGIRSILVLSGVSTRAQLTALDYQPQWVFHDIVELTTQWQADL
ncbi:MAG: HAD-IIA family hydrolase, partial [Chloroflexi bacterium]|nr:HAD-IIA family hydrolase [Chloroflexota bacterium]